MHVQPFMKDYKKIDKQIEKLSVELADRREMGESPDQSFSFKRSQWQLGKLMKERAALRNLLS